MGCVITPRATTSPPLAPPSLPRTDLPCPQTPPPTILTVLVSGDHGLGLGVGRLRVGTLGVRPRGGVWPHRGGVGPRRGGGVRPRPLRKARLGIGGELGLGVGAGGGGRRVGGLRIGRGGRGLRPPEAVGCHQETLLVGHRDPPRGWCCGERESGGQRGRPAPPSITPPPRHPPQRHFPLPHHFPGPISPRPSPSRASRRRCCPPGRRWWCVRPHPHRYPIAGGSRCGSPPSALSPRTKWPPGGGAVAVATPPPRPDGRYGAGVCPVCARCVPDTQPAAVPAPPHPHPRTSHPRHRHRHRHRLGQGRPPSPHSRGTGVQPDPRGSDRPRCRGPRRPRGSRRLASGTLPQPPPVPPLRLPGPGGTETRRLREWRPRPPPPPVPPPRR